MVWTICHFDNHSFENVVLSLTNVCQHRREFGQLIFHKEAEICAEASDERVDLVKRLALTVDEDLEQLTELRAAEALASLNSLERLLILQQSFAKHFGVLVAEVGIREALFWEIQNGWDHFILVDQIKEFREHFHELIVAYFLKLFLVKRVDLQSKLERSDFWSHVSLGDFFNEFGVNFNQVIVCDKAIAL